MIDEKKRRKAMKKVLRHLERASEKICRVAYEMEGLLDTEADMAQSREYGTACHTIGVLFDLQEKVKEQLNGK